MKNRNLIFAIGFCAMLFYSQAPCQTFDDWYDAARLNFGFTSYLLMNPPPVPVRDAARLVATDIHVYYIGTNDKVCDYVWNGTQWANGMQLEWSSHYVQSKTQIRN